MVVFIANQYEINTQHADRRKKTEWKNIYLGYFQLWTPLDPELSVVTVGWFWMWKLPRICRKIEMASKNLAFYFN